MFGLPLFRRILFDLLIPTPITMEELEDMLMDFGIMKTEEQALAELQAKEAAAAAKAAASA